jgi:hypothetical protein
MANFTPAVASDGAQEYSENGFAAVPQGSVMRNITENQQWNRESGG